MFDSKKYKKFAKIQLKNRWHVPVLIILFTGLITGFLRAPSIIRETKLYNTLYENYGTELADAFESGSSLQEINPKILERLAMDDSNFLEDAMDFAVLIVTMIFSIATIHVYIKMSKSPEPVKFSTFIEGFSLWIRGILAGFLKILLLYLWSLLFFFPAVIKFYSYRFQIYLVAEYPELSITKALKISSIITKGYKFKLFVQDLSFIGWGILGCLTLGISTLYSIPYYNMTLTNSYHGLLKEAVETGKISIEDLK